MRTTCTDTAFWNRRRLSSLLVDRDLETLPCSVLATGTWCLRPGMWAPSPAGLVEASRAGAPLPHPHPGELGTPAAKAGTRRSFPAILGIGDSWFHQASCTGVRVRGRRIPGRWPEAGWGWHSPLTTATTVDHRDEQKVHFPSHSPSLQGVWFHYCEPSCTGGKLRPSTTNPSCRDLALSQGFSWPRAPSSCMDITPC